MVSNTKKNCIIFILLLSFCISVCKTDATTINLSNTQTTNTLESISHRNLSHSKNEKNWISHCIEQAQSSLDYYKEPIITHAVIIIALTLAAYKMQKISYDEAVFITQQFHPFRLIPHIFINSCKVFALTTCHEIGHALIYNYFYNKQSSITIGRNSFDPLVTKPINCCLFSLENCDITKGFISYKKNATPDTTTFSKATIDALQKCAGPLSALIIHYCLKVIENAYNAKNIGLALQQSLIPSFLDISHLQDLLLPTNEYADGASLIPYRYNLESAHAIMYIALIASEIIKTKQFSLFNVVTSTITASLNKLCRGFITISLYE